MMFRSCKISCSRKASILLCSNSISSSAFAFYAVVVLCVPAVYFGLAVLAHHEMGAA
jgi:hypothetical protein